MRRMITRCYVMSEDSLDNINRKLLALQHTVEGMRKSDRREGLLKAIRSVRGELWVNCSFGGEE